jgi:hypothetical protein
MTTKKNALLAVLLLLHFNSIFGQNSLNEESYSFRQYMTDLGSYKVMIQSDFEQLDLSLSYLDEVENRELKKFQFSNVYSLSLFFGDPKAKTSADLTNEMKWRYSCLPYKVSLDTLGMLRRDSEFDKFKTMLPSADKSTFEIVERNFSTEKIRHELETYGNSPMFRRYLLKKGTTIVDTLYCCVTEKEFKPVFFNLKALSAEELAAFQKKWNDSYKILRKPVVEKYFNENFGERLLKEIFTNGDIYVYKVLFNATTKNTNPAKFDHVFKVDKFIFSNLSPEKITKESLLKNTLLENEDFEITFKAFEFLKKINLIELYTFNCNLVKRYGVDYNKFIDLGALNEPYEALKKNKNTSLTAFTKDYFLSKIGEDRSFITDAVFVMKLENREIKIVLGNNTNYTYMPFEPKDFSTNETIYASTLDFSSLNYRFYPWQSISDNFSEIKENLANRCVERMYEIKNELSAAQNQNESEQKALKELEVKYGKKYVDAAMSGNILVGMPEDLLEFPLRLWSVDRKTMSNGTQTYYFTSKLDSSTKLSVSIKSGKVTNVYTW